MMKLALRILLLTAVLEGASLAFAMELVLTTLILVTIAVITGVVLLRRDAEEPVSAGILVVEAGRDELDADASSSLEGRRK